MPLGRESDAAGCAVDAYIGLGSNLLDPRAQVRRALLELHAMPDTDVLLHSSLYKSKPMGAANQPDFINAVAKVSTCLEPVEMLHALQDIERRHQRVRKRERWASRTLDLDILLYGDLQTTTERLQIPHYGIAERAFVLIPLQEIEESLVIPGHGTLRELIDGLPSSCRLAKVEVEGLEPQA